MARYEGLAAARRQVELIYGDPDFGVDLRFLKKGSAAITWENCHLTPHIWGDLDRNQSAGYDAYIKPNIGGWKDAEIVAAYAIFVDGDDIPIPEPLDWHVQPDFIVSRSETRWQAWWAIKDGIANIDLWRPIQLALAQLYGTDRMVATEATLMRLAGTMNLKGFAVPYVLDDFS